MLSDIAAEARHIIDVSRGLPTSPEDTMRFGSWVTPLDAELMEVTRTQGFNAAQKIQEQFGATNSVAHTVAKAAPTASAMR